MTKAEDDERELPTKIGHEHVPKPKWGDPVTERPMGPYREPCGYLLVRDNGTMFEWFETRHEAVREATRGVYGLFDETVKLRDNYWLVYTHPDAVPFENLRWRKTRTV